MTRTEPRHRRPAAPAARVAIGALAVIALHAYVLLAGCASTSDSPATQDAPPAAPVELTAEADRARLMQRLGIAALRSGADPRNAQSPAAVNYDEAQANPVRALPDPLVDDRGRRVASARDWWERRRPEIVRHFDREIYGRVPVVTPVVRWDITATKREMQHGREVVTKTLVGHVDNSRYPAVSVDMQLVVTTPADAKDGVPVILELGFIGTPPFGQPAAGASAANAAARPALPDWRAQVLAQGWGYAVIAPNSIQPDNGAGLTRGIIGLVNQGRPREPDQWGALRAWAWGASRALDYLQSDPAVDGQRVGIEGMSRYGKAALVAMAYDQRFAIGYIASSGAGGAKLARRNFGERVENVAATNEYHWMAGNYLKYAGPLTPEDMPVDAHHLIALAAPRPLFVGAGSLAGGDGWVDTRGMLMAQAGAGPVYRLLGARDLGSSTLPPTGTALTGGELGFREHDGGHTPAPNWPHVRVVRTALLRRRAADAAPPGRGRGSHGRHAALAAGRERRARAGIPQAAGLPLRRLEHSRVVGCHAGLSRCAYRSRAHARCVRPWRHRPDLRPPQQPAGRADRRGAHAARDLSEHGRRSGRPGELQLRAHGRAHRFHPRHRRAGAVPPRPQRGLEHGAAARRAEYATIAKHIVLHYNRGWAKGFRYGIKYWEVWNEPDLGRLFWGGTPQQFYELYGAIARAVKVADPDARVGGPAIARPNDDNPYREGFLDYVRAQQLPLDFFSWHWYATDSNDPQDFVRVARNLRELLDARGFSRTESVLNEWNYGLMEPWPEDIQRAAFVTAATMYMQDAPVDLTALYRADNLFGPNGYQPVKTGQALIALGRMRDTPVRVAASGADEDGFAVLAGRSRDGKMLQVLIGNYEIPPAFRGKRGTPDRLTFGDYSLNLLARRTVSYRSNNGYDLRIAGLDAQREYVVERFRITADESFAAAGSRRVRGAELRLFGGLQAPGVELIRISPAPRAP